MRAAALELLVVLLILTVPSAARKKKKRKRRKKRRTVETEVLPEGGTVGTRIGTVRRVSGLTLERLLNEFHDEPVIVTDAMSEWPAMHKWTVRRARGGAGTGSGLGSGLAGGAARACPTQ